MLILAQEPAVQNITIQAAPPWWNIIAAVLGALVAGGIAVTGWIYVHRKSQSRDLENWRRTAVAKAVTELIEASEKRFEIIRKSSGDSDQLQREAESKKIFSQIELCRYQIQISAADTDVEDRAVEIFSKHQQSDGAITLVRDWEMEFSDTKATLHMKWFDKTVLHHELIRATQRELKQNVSEPIVRDHAEVLQ
ncbi:hypothetical protein [Rhodococcus sovatensis]|uniref:DUF4760 domain-containing protein n=1 Tax=Rhodococcus sovatensis TaxID=1805840 RepID=A0ABZ2PW17_9NOCA